MLYENKKKLWLWEKNAYFRLEKISLPPKVRCESWIIEECRGTYPLWTAFPNSQDVDWSVLLSRKWQQQYDFNNNQTENNILLNFPVAENWILLYIYKKFDSQIVEPWIFRLLYYLICLISQSSHRLSWDSKEPTMPWCYHSCGCWTIWPLWGDLSVIQRHS